MNMKERINQFENDEKFPSWHILHQLLELAMDVTGRGDIGDDYTKTVEFPIGNITIFSDPYYGNIQIEENDLDDKQIHEIIHELKKRLLQFDKKISSMRTEAVAEIFDKPLNIESIDDTND